VLTVATFIMIKMEIVYKLVILKWWQMNL